MFRSHESVPGDGFDATSELSPEQDLQITVEVFSEAGSPSRANEDVVFADASKGIAGVFDGVSDIVGFRTPDGLTGGAIAAQLAADVFATVPIHQPLAYSLRQASQAVAAKQRDALGFDPPDKTRRFGTTAAVARVRTDAASNCWVDLLQVADSVAIVVYEDGRVEAPLGLYDQDLETMRLWSRLARRGFRGDGIRRHPEMEAQIASKRNESNETYGVINGEDVPEHFVLTTTLPATGVAKVLLLTDGMFIPKEDPAAPEDWRIYAELEDKGGLRAIYGYVRSIELSDPGRTCYPRTKMCDDASGAVITLGQK